MKRYKVFIVLVLALLLTLLATSCTRPKKVEVQKNEIVLVNHTSLTGGLADYGQAARTGIELAVADFSPFKIGDTEYSIKLLSLDDKGDQAESAIVAQNAVDRDAVAIIGALTSGNTNAALPIYKKANIPMISPSATRPDLTEAGHKVFFRTCLRDDLQGDVLGKWAASLGFKKVTVMDDKGDYAVALADVVEKTLKDNGVEVQREHTVEGEVDFSAQISNIKGFASEAVIFTGYHREAGLLRKQMVEAGLKDVKFMGGDGIKSEDIFKEAGGNENAEGMMCTFGLDRSAMPKYEDFKEKYQEKTGKEPGPYSENAYDAVGILVAAMQKAGTTDGGAVIEALHEIDYSGVIGKFSFDEKGDIKITGGISKFEGKDGKWVPVVE